MTMTAMKERATLADAVRALAKVDDYASSLDGQGFNKFDAEFGNKMALTPWPAWTPKQKRAVWRMLRKYRRQLLMFGINYEQLEEPPADAQTTTKKPGRAWIEGDDQVVVRFNWDPRNTPPLVTELKKLPGRSWDGKNQVWRFPIQSLGPVKGFCDQHGLEMSEEVGQAKAAAAEPDTLKLAGQQLVLKSAYDKAKVDHLRAIPGAWWDRQSKVWRFPLIGLAVQGIIESSKHLGWENQPQSDSWTPAERTLEEALKIWKWETTPNTLRAMKEALEQAEHLRKASKAEDAVLDIHGLGGELMPFQKAGVKYALATRRCFIADEMGLGKTVQALAAIHAAQAYPAVIVCPAFLKLNWQKEAQKWLPGKKVVILEGKKVDRAHGYLLDYGDIFIINYDILGNWDAEAKDMKPGSWAGALAERKPAAVVFDESHYCKNPGTEKKPVHRTRAAKVLAKSAKQMALLLTGTPIVNRPAELVSQLDILGMLNVFGGRYRFERKYCDASNNGFGWDAAGAAESNVLVELNDLLRTTCYVRREKKDVLKELPAKVRSEQRVEPDPKVMVEYRRAEADVISFLSDKARTIAEELGEDADSAAVEAAMRAQSAEQLVRMNALKRLAAKATIPAALKWSQDFLESTGKKLVVWAHHRDVVEELADKLNAPYILGGMDPQRKEDIVTRFQTDPDLKVLVCGIKAAGVGITLTAASDCVFVELAWTPGDHDQAEDRNHRIGQEDSVTGWYMIPEDTIYEDIYELIAQKRVVCDSVNKGEAQQIMGQSILGEVTARLAAKGREALV